MTDDTPELDPDQRTCPRCGAEPGHVCRQPNGAKAARIHAARRADQSDQSSSKTRPPNNATSDGRSRGGKVAAQRRNRRRSELAARAEERREQLEAEKLEQEAERLAADAARYATDRAALRRNVLDATAETVTALRSTTKNLKRTVVDEDGKPIPIPVEVKDKSGVTLRDDNGEAITRLDPDVRGYTTAADVNRMATAAAAMLNALRLEEGKATSITEERGATGAAGVLGEAGTAELLAWAQQNAGQLDGNSEKDGGG